MTWEPVYGKIIEVSAGMTEKIMARDGGELRVSPTSPSQRWPSGFPAAALNVTGTAPLAILKFKKTLKKVLTFRSDDVILLKLGGEPTLN